MLNHSVTFAARGREPGSFGLTPGTRFGRLPPPATVACKASGNPDCSVRMPETFHPPIILSDHGVNIAHQIFSTAKGKIGDDIDDQRLRKIIFGERILGSQVIVVLYAGRVRGFNGGICRWHVGHPLTEGIGNEKADAMRWQFVDLNLRCLIIRSAPGCILFQHAGELGIRQKKLLPRDRSVRQRSDLDIGLEGIWNRSLECCAQAQTGRIERVELIIAGEM